MDSFFFFLPLQAVEVPVFEGWRKMVVIATINLGTCFSMSKHSSSLYHLILPCCCCLVAKSCLTFCDRMDCGLSGDFPGKNNTGVKCHFLPQVIFSTQRSNLHLRHAHCQIMVLSRYLSLILFKILSFLLLIFFWSPCIFMLHVSFL